MSIAVGSLGHCSSFKTVRSLHDAGYGLANVAQRRASTPDTRFRIASLTKQFTAVALLQMQERGQLDLDDLVVGHLPDIGFDPRITIRHLLSHRSGLPEFTQTFPFHRNSNPDVATVISHTLAQPFDFTPGTQFSYSNSG